MRKIFIFLIASFVFIQQALAAPHSMQINLSPDGVEFKVIAPNGKATGYDPNIKKDIIPNIEEIDGANYGGYTIPGESSSAGREFSMIREIASGSYKIVCYGMKQTNYGFTVAYDWDVPTTPAILQVSKGGFAYPGSVTTYEMIVPDTPSSSVVIYKIANPDSLIMDIQDAFRFEELGNEKFVLDLSTQIKLIKNNQKQEYQAILDKLTKLYNSEFNKNEFITAGGYKMLKEDLEYIINHTQ